MGSERERQAPAATVVHLPPWRHILRRVAAQLAESTFVPSALLYLLLGVAGLVPALLSALGWCYAALVWRRATGRDVPAVLLLNAALLTARTGVAIGTASAALYFVAPVVTAYVTAMMFGGSLVVRRPLAVRLTRDFVSLPETLLGHRCIRRLLATITLAWALTNFVSGFATMQLLLAGSIREMLVLRATAFPALTALVAAASIVTGRSVLARHGVRFAAAGG